MRKRNRRSIFRFSLRRLMLLVLLAALACWIFPRWGEWLVSLRADKVLVPTGLATYGHPSHFGDQTSDSSRAVWIGRSNCKHCHSAVSGFLAFPGELQHHQTDMTRS